MKNTIKHLLHTVGLYDLVAKHWAWALTLVNYWLMRLPLGVRAWPHSLYIEGTNICNAACVFCAYPKMKRQKAVMPISLYRRVVDDYCRLGGGEVDVTPIVGDPFADAKLFERLDYLAAQPRVRRFHFYTNGILMRPTMHLRLLAYREKLSINVSFGGFDKATYATMMGVDKFEAALENVMLLIIAKRESRSAMKIQINIRAPSLPHGNAILDLLRDRQRDGLITLTWMRTYDNWGGEIDAEALRFAGLEARPMPSKRGPCHRLLTSPTVLADGRVSACGCRDIEATLIIGDLTKQSLGEVLGGKPLKDLLAQHAAGDFPDVCKRCMCYDSVYPPWFPGQKAPEDPSVPVV